WIAGKSPVLGSIQSLAVVSPAKKKVTLIGYYCLKWIFGYYCINPSCILQSESVNGTNAGRKSLAE
ncbi:unnamed protein product, partial [Brassica oleracea]